MEDDGMIVVLGSRVDCLQARAMLGAAGVERRMIALPSAALFGRRLDLDRLYVFDSWAEEMQEPRTRAWAEEELLCRYADVDAAARKIGLT